MPRCWASRWLWRSFVFPSRLAGRLCRTRIVTVLFFFGGVAGESQEHIVERWSTNAHVGGAYRRAVDTANCFREHVYAYAIADGNRHLAAAPIDLWRLGDARQYRCAAIEVGRIAQRHDQHIAAQARLELVGRAFGDEQTVIDHDDTVGELVGFFEILSREQHGCALVHQFANE